MNHKNTLSYPAPAAPLQLPAINKIKLPKVFWGIFLFIFVTTFSLLGYEQVYAQKTYEGVRIAGVSVGGKTKAEIEKILNQKTKSWSEESVIIAYSSETLKPIIKDLGITFDVQKQVEEVFSVGRGENWLKSQTELVKTIFVGKNLPLIIQIDENKLNEFLVPLEAKFEKPQNASLKIDGQNVSIVAAKEGVALDKESFLTDLKNRVSYLSPEPITLLAKETKPLLYEEDVQKTKAQAEEIISKPLTLTYENKVYKADETQIAAFLKFEEKNNQLLVGFSDEAIDKFIATIAKKIDIKAKDKEVMVNSGIVLDEGKDGRALDRESTKAQIKQALVTPAKASELKVVEKKRGEKTIYPAGTPGLYEGKYIEIVLSKQTVYAFEGQTMVSSFLISSGLPGTPTPTGTFSIFSKSRSVLMTGPGYYLPNVQWVNRFYNGYSIHGTYWHNNFGRPMSHGCVNASNANASFIYSWAPIGTPVYIHK